MLISLCVVVPRVLDSRNSPVAFRGDPLRLDAIEDARVEARGEKRRNESRLRMLDAYIAGKSCGSISKCGSFGRNAYLGEGERCSGGALVHTFPSSFSSILSWIHPPLFLYSPPIFRGWVQRISCEWSSSWSKIVFYLSFISSVRKMSNHLRVVSIIYTTSERSIVFENLETTKRYQDAPFVKS